MNGWMKKATLGLVLGATALGAAAPAEAQRWGGYRGYRGDGGRVASGALLGGLLGLGVGAAIASSNRDRYYDRGYYYDAPPPPPRVVYRDRYYSPPPVVVRERYYDAPGYYGRGYGQGYYGGGYGGGYYDRGYGYGY